MKDGYWNYRILARRINSEIQYGVYEVHYNEYNSIVAYTENPIQIFGYSDDEDPIENIKWQLDAMLLALDKAILDYDNFPNEYLKYSRLNKLLQIDKLLQNDKL